MNDLKEKLKRIAELTCNDVGKSEENVKQKIVVPLLECLGHHRNQLEFEYGTGGKRIDIFVKGLPPDCKVIVDTKNYNEDLSKHLEQIGFYAFQEGALLALIVNGEEIRIYDPFFRGFNFKDSLLYSFKISELTNNLTMEILYGLLSRENLKSKNVKDFIIKREQEIKDTRFKIEGIEDKYEKKKMELSTQREALIKKLAEIQENIETIKKQISNVDTEKYDEINRVLKSTGLHSRTTPPEISSADIQERRTRNVSSKHALPQRRGQNINKELDKLWVQGVQKKDAVESLIKLFGGTKKLNCARYDKGIWRLKEVGIIVQKRPDGSHKIL